MLSTRNGRLVRGCALVALVLLSAAARAEVSSRLEAFRVTTDTQGKEQVNAATTTTPGDVIEYRIRYENTDAKPVTSLAVNGPVPEGTELLADSAKTSAKHTLAYSIDGGKTFSAAPIKRTTDKGVNETVAVNQYNAVQWRVLEPLKKGSPIRFSYRVRINAAPDKK